MQGVPSRPDVIFRAEQTVAGLAAGSGLNDSNVPVRSIVASAYRKIGKLCHGFPPIRPE